MHFDTVIIGCGTTGSMLAARLSADPSRTVCAIEAGPDYQSSDQVPRRVFEYLAPPEATSDSAPESLSTTNFLVNSPWNWKFTARSTPLAPSIQLPRGKLVGGSSAVNGCTWLWPVREDLDAWAKAGNTDWGYEDCLPYLAAIEHDTDFPGDHHGASGPIRVQRTPRSAWLPVNEAFTEACSALGFPECADFNAPDAFGVGPIPKNFGDFENRGLRVRYSTLIGYLLPVHNRPNLTVIADSLATRIIVADGRARGVEVLVDGTPTVIEGDEILLAAGAVGSPHLLMLSGIGPAASLKAAGIEPVLDLPGVGQNLRDHPVLIASWAAQDVVVPPSVTLTVQTALRATTPGSSGALDMQLFSFRDEGRDRFGLPFTLNHADSAGELRLQSSDPTVPPSIDFRHLDQESDRARMRRMLELLDEIVAQAPFRKFHPARIVPDRADSLGEWMLSTPATGHHISSTCKMGAESDPLAVVDGQGRVFGLDALRIVDSSILVDCPRANINATVMMVAEKIASSTLLTENAG
jgi:choline dehydrogenase